MFVEPSIQAWTLNAHWLMDIADFTYLNAHYIVTLGALVFIYVRRNRSFYFVRNMFMIAMAIALVGYAVYPTAPPRLLPEWGFTDTIQQFTGITVERGAGSALLNLYAAVPSMHVCFALMVGIPMSMLVKRWPAKVAWRFYPVVITFVVVATGNHYLTDVFLGALTAGISALLADRVLARARPDAWSFSRDPAPVSDGCARRRTRSHRRMTRMPDQTQPSTTANSDPARDRALAAGGGRAGPTTQELMRERLIESRLTPNTISLTGFALNLAAAGLVVGRLFFLAGIAFIVGSIMDTLDGRYSRMSGKGTPFGAFLDSTLDRLEEGIVLTAVGAYFASRHNQVAVAAVVVAVLFSLMVSYTRARAEALGVACKVGLATRPVRVVILSVGLVFAKGASIGDFELLAPAVYVLAGLTVFTTIQRIVYVRGQLKAA